MDVPEKLDAHQANPVPTNRQLASTATLNPLDAFWHLSNFFLPAWAVAALMAGGAKLLWRRELKALAWRRLTVWGGWGGSAGLILALVLLGRDGKMLGYGLMLLGISLPQCILSFRPGR
jgi:hypothetical protein